MDLNFGLFALIIFLAFFSQAAIGFGGGVIALTLGAFIYPLDVMLNWVAPLVILLSIWMLARHHDHIDWKLFLKSILPAMGTGMVLGQLLYYKMDSDTLKIVLGIVVILLSARSLISPSKSTKPRAFWPWTLSAGIIHGMTHSGGPLLVYGMNQQNVDKAAFRSTLLLVWMVMSCVLVTSYIISGQLTTAELPRIGLLALILPFSVIAGELAHKHLDQDVFKKVINVVLILCGFALIFG